MGFVWLRLWIGDDGAGRFVNARSMIVLPFPQQDIKVFSGATRFANRSPNLIREAVKEGKIGRPILGDPSPYKYHQLAGLLGGDDIVGDIERVAEHAGSICAVEGQRVPLFFDFSLLLRVELKRGSIAPFMARLLEASDVAFVASRYLCRRLLGF